MAFGSGGATVQRQRALLKHRMKVTTDTPPTHLYVGLSKTDPTEDGSGITEPSGGGYARVICDGWTESDPISGDNAGANVVNTALIDFGVPSGDWATGGATIGYWFIADALTSGNIREVGKFNTAQPVLSGNPVQIAAGALTVSAGWLTPHS